MYGGTPSVKPVVLFVPTIAVPAVDVVTNPVAPMLPEACVCTD